MKKYLYIAASLLVTIVATSCNKEDDVNVDLSDPREHFVPLDSDTSETADLRRAFNTEEKSFLLFNDTIQKVYNGKDLNGENNYFVEVIDLNYTVGSSYNYVAKPYTFTYLETLEKKKTATDFLKNYILIHLPQKLRPFSWLVVGNIYTHDAQGSLLKPYAVAGERCIALAYALLPNFKTEAKKKEYANRQLLVIIDNMVSNYPEAFNDFKEISNKKYSAGISVPEGKTALEVVMENGFLSNPHTNQYQSFSEDVSSYTQMVLSSTEERINKKYANYPKILEKVKLYKTAMESLGYIF